MSGETTTNRFRIRFALPGESAQVAELLQHLQDHQQLAGVERIPGREEVERELYHSSSTESSEGGRVLANNRGTFVVVALDLEEAEKIIGYLIYTQSYSLARGRYMYLNSFFLEAPYRAHGLGTKFIKFMQLHCKLLGYSSCDICVMKNNLRGQKFYKRFGAYLVDAENQLHLSPV